jgi:hypothetical protein
MIRRTPFRIAAPGTSTVDNWRKFAACIDDPDAMFPGRKPEDTVKAKAVCHGCPVYRTCLDDVIRAEGSIGADRRHGIVAALTGPERYSVWRRLSRRGVTP